MKVTRTNNKTKPKINFPCIMELTTNPEVIVYVTGEKDEAYMGIALSHPSIEHWDKEITNWDMSVLVPMKGRVILEND
jgi:hypothetical protein